MGTIWQIRITVARGGWGELGCCDLWNLESHKAKHKHNLHTRTMKKQRAGDSQGVIRTCFSEAGQYFFFLNKRHVYRWSNNGISAAKWSRRLDFYPGLWCWILPFVICFLKKKKKYAQDNSSSDCSIVRSLSLVCCIADRRLVSVSWTMKALR